MSSKVLPREWRIKTPRSLWFNSACFVSARPSTHGGVSAGLASAEAAGERVFRICQRGWEHLALGWFGESGDAGIRQVRFRFPGVRKQPWYYPSSEDCLNCHTRAAQFVLGVKTRQLNRDFPYPYAGVAANELRVWNRLQLFEPALQENELNQLDRLVPLTEVSAPLELRVRS